MPPATGARSKRFTILMDGQAVERVTQRRMANAIRALAMDAVEAAASGHPGMPMGMGGCRHCALHPVSEVRPEASGVAGPGPLCALGRSRVHAALCAAPSVGLRRHVAGRDPQVQTAGKPYCGPPRIRRKPRHRDDHRTARPGFRQRRRHGPWRKDHGRSLRRPRRSPHLGHCRRWLPDGGNQPRSRLSGGPPRAQPPDRSVRRQRHLDRRADLTRRLR